ncbi:hypothetical protein GCM10009799_27880 [Nocardiopsis rhodophaea]|uniref:Single-stranded DNA-binding protein n=1 Tax=Nocardiopsis rhodophaea TaxID=280238 RepID=A0ABN2T5E7_9ACTN
MNATIVTVVGRLVRDPEVKFLEDGTALCRFTVVTAPRVFDRATGKWGDGDPVFLSCSAWRLYAENIAASVGRGSRVIVVGELRQRSYTSSGGQARTIVDLRVHDLAPTLRWTAARVTRSGWVDAASAGARPEPRGEERERWAGSSEGEEAERKVSVPLPRTGGSAPAVPTSPVPLSPSPRLWSPWPTVSALRSGESAQEEGDPPF